MRALSRRQGEQRHNPWGAACPDTARQQELHLFEITELRAVKPPVSVVLSK